MKEKKNNYQPKLPQGKDLIIGSINGGPDKIYPGKFLETGDIDTIQFEIEARVDTFQIGDDFDLVEIFGPDEITKIP